MLVSGSVIELIFFQKFTGSSRVLEGSVKGPSLSGTADQLRLQQILRKRRVSGWKLEAGDVERC